MSRGRINYCCVAISGTVASEYVGLSGNFSAVARQRIVPNVSKLAKEKISLESEKVLFHVTSLSDLIVVCAADQDYPRHLAFTFLEDIRRQFCQQFPEPRNPAQCTNFNKLMKDRVQYFNSPEADKLRKLQSQLDEVKDVMVRNIETVLERGEKIDSLVDKTNELAVESDHFFVGSRELKRKMWLKNMKLIALIILVLLVIVFIIVLIACGGFKFEKCKSNTQ